MGKTDLCGKATCLSANPFRRIYDVRTSVISGVRRSALALTIAAALFAGVWREPYEIENDAAIRVKTIIQFYHGSVPAPHFIAAPDPADLSQDKLRWISWWPPGFTYIYSIAPSLGVPLALAARGTTFILFVVGCIGWLRVTKCALPSEANRREPQAYSLPSYAFGYLTSTAALRPVENNGYIGFARNIPLVRDWWPVKYFEHRNTTGRGAAALFGLILGATAWLKSSLAVLVWSVLIITIGGMIWSAPAKRRSRFIAEGLVAGLMFATSSVALGALNQWLGGHVTGVAEFRDVDYGSNGSRDWRSLLSLLGGPGLAIFGTSDPVRHLCVFLVRL